MALVENGTNGERTMTVLPWHRQGRQHSAPAQSDDLIPSCHGSLALCVRSGRRAFSASHRHKVFKDWHSTRSFILPIPYGIISALCFRESFFCEVTLDLPNCKACLVNNLPLGSKCLKRILHASLALFDLSALQKAEKSSRHTAERL